MSQAISKAKAGLILKQPFFASLLLSMPMTEDSSLLTMGTNGLEIRYNEVFVNSLSHDELTFVLAHEVMHCVFQHMTRRGSRNANRWNIAGDYIINDLLVKDRIGKMPECGLLDADLVSRGEGTTEGVYALLPEETEDKAPGTPGGSMDEVQDAGKDAAELAEREAEMRVKVIQAKNAAKAAGMLSAGLERTITELAKPRVDWKRALREFLSARAKSELSFAKPKRRWLAEDLCLPSLTGERLGKITVAVDCSGSIGERELAEFSAEINAIVEDTSPESVEVIYFDTEVTRTECFEQAEPVVLKGSGGGGTTFSPIFEYLSGSHEPPIAVVVLTDLYANDFGEAPDMPVLWACTRPGGKAPFGQVLTMERD